MVILVEELRSRASLTSSLCVCGDCVCIYPSNLIPQFHFYIFMNLFFKGTMFS